MPLVARLLNQRSSGMAAPARARCRRSPRGTLRRVVADEPREVGGDATLLDQREVVRDAQRHDRGQQGQVLAQHEHAGGRAAVVAGGVRPQLLDAAAGALARPGVHAGLVGVGVRAHVDPLDAQRQAARRRAVLHQGRPGAVGEHPAQELDVEGQVAAAVGDARGAQHAGAQVAAGELAGAAHRAVDQPGADLGVGRLQRRHAAGADAVQAGEVAGRDARLALHQAGEAGDQDVAERGRGGEVLDGGRRHAGLRERRADRARRHGEVGVRPPAGRVQRVVPGADAVERQHPRAVARGLAVVAAEDVLQRVVAHRRAGHEGAQRGDVGGAAGGGGHVRVRGGGGRGAARAGRGRAGAAAAAPAGRCAAGTRAGCAPRGAGRCARRPSGGRAATPTSAGCGRGGGTVW